MSKLLSFAALAVSLVTIGYVVTTRNDQGSTPGTEVAVKASLYDQVQASKTLRCAYASFAPLTIVDPNTKQLSGIFYDLINEIGKRLGIKVEWVEEVNYGTINAGFQTGRYDAFCTGLWPVASRAGNTLFTDGLVWDPVGVFVRQSDTRFDQDISKLNDQQFTMVFWDGDGTQSMTNALFPNTKPLPMGQGVTFGEYMQQIVTHKADAGLATKLAGQNFIDANPNTVREVSLARPIRFYPLTIGLPEHEFALKKMLDTVIFEIQDDGTVAKTVRKYLGEKSNLLYEIRHDYKSF